MKSKKPTKKELMSDDEKKALTHKRRKSGYSRKKGHTFERDIAVSLRHIFPEARRLLENHKDDAKGVDILHTGLYRIQCKKYQNYVSPGRIKEVQCDELLGEVPVLITAGDNKRPLVVIPYDEFLRLLEASLTK